MSKSVTLFRAILYRSQPKRKSRSRPNRPLSIDSQRFIKFTTRSRPNRTLNIDREHFTLIWPFWQAITVHPGFKCLQSARYNDTYKTACINSVMEIKGGLKSISTVPGHILSRRCANPTRIPSRTKTKSLREPFFVDCPSVFNYASGSNRPVNLWASV